MRGALVAGVLFLGLVWPGVTQSAVDNEEMARQLQELESRLAAQERLLEEQQRRLAAQEEELRRLRAADQRDDVDAVVREVLADAERRSRLGGDLDAVYDRGLVVRSEDDNYLLRIGGWIQPRYEFTRRSDDEDLSSFFLRRVRLDITGHLFTDQLTFRVMPELARTASMRDAWINYAFAPELALRAGQFNVPFQWHRHVSPRRQHFAERSVPSETFGFPTGRDLGLMAHGILRENTIVYGVGVFDGSGRNTQFSNSDGNMWTGRLTLAAMGKLPREESDYAFSEEPMLAFGLGVQGATENEARAWDLGRSLAGNTRADWITATADTRFAWNGFSFVAEGFLRSVNPDDPLVGSYDGWAYTLSAGYFIVPKRYEIVARFSELILDRDAGETREQEWGFGLNIYHKGHDWKTRINFLSHDTGAGDTQSIIIEHHLQF